VGVHFVKRSKTNEARVGEGSSNSTTKLNYTLLFPFIASKYLMRVTDCSIRVSQWLGMEGDTFPPPDPLLDHNY